MLLAIVLILLGIGLLYAGGEALVDNSIRLAQAFGLSKMIIGLTVVAFATSSPELGRLTLQSSPSSMPMAWKPPST
jgi:cation:H+ antiporter